MLIALMYQRFESDSWCIVCVIVSKPTSIFAPAHGQWGMWVVS